MSEYLSVCCGKGSCTPLHIDAPFCPWCSRKLEYYNIPKLENRADQTNYIVGKLKAFHENKDWYGGIVLTRNLPDDKLLLEAALEELEKQDQKHFKAKRDLRIRLKEL